MPANGLSTNKNPSLYVAPLAFLLRALLITSNKQLKNLSSGKLPFITAFINALLIFSAFNLFDLVGIDYLPFITIQPSFVVLPGTVGTTSYEEVTFHAVNFLMGVGFSLLSSAAAASLSSRRAMWYSLNPRSCQCVFRAAPASR